jgi:hypothetical protein
MPSNRLRRLPGMLMPGLTACLLAAALLGHGAPAAAQQAEARSQVASEARLQAAYLLKFPAYVEWPDGRQPQPAGAVVIALAEGDEVGAELRKIAERMPAGARPVIRSVRAGDSLAGVHVLYVGGDDWPRYGRWVQQAHTHGVLLVSAHSGALDYGGMLNFRVVDDRLRFEVSLESVDKARLRIGAQLLSLAVTVNRAK